MRYIITFYAHIGAVRYKKLCQSQGINAKIMPVPRELSSSCGSCVFTQDRYAEPTERVAEEVEQIVKITDTGYSVVLDLR